MFLKRIKSEIEEMFPRKRRKQIEDWDFIMVFELQHKEQITEYFSHIKCQDHVKFSFIDNKESEQILVLIAMDERIVIDQAHELKILKPKDKRSFALTEKECTERIAVAEKENSHHYADYLRFIRSRFQPENRRIAEQEKLSVFNKHKIQKFERDSHGDLFTPEEQLRAKYNYLLVYKEAVEHQSVMEDAFRFPFIEVMKHPAFEEILPIHKNAEYRPIIFGSLQRYIGSNEQVYFDFVGFLQKWLIFPAAIGLVTFLFNYFYEFTADDSPGDFVYSLLVMVWSIYFITSWENESKWMKAKEASGYNDDLWALHQNITSKEGMKKRISRVTGREEDFVPFRDKAWYYFVSIGSCLVMVVASIYFMVLSLNARGFVDPDHKLLYNETLSSWAAKGGIFDADTWWGQIPNLVHVIVTNGFDESFYRPLAKKLTRYERHLTSKTHSDSIILKYFIFEFLITFADFFYIAFIRFDIIGLREQLLSLFFIDIVRRLVAETLIPWLKNKYVSYKMRGNLTVRVPKEKELRHYAIMEVNKEHFESFDDYLEIITNFGYLAMISSCFPLAPALIIIAHAVEILQDRYKLVHIYRRKLPHKFVGMGYWKDIIVFICYFSIITNILLFAFSSQQIVSIFPMLFEGGKNIVLGKTDLSDVFGDAAINVFSTMVSMGAAGAKGIRGSSTAGPFDFLKNLTPNIVNASASGSCPNVPPFLNDPLNSGAELPTITPSAFGGIPLGDLPESPEKIQTREQAQDPSEALVEGSEDGQSRLTGWEEMDDLFKDPLATNTVSDSSSANALSVSSAGPPLSEEHKFEMIGILFLLEHIFLIGFILFRGFLSKKKNLAQIFLERRDYKRKVKKYLHRDILVQTLRDEMVTKLLSDIKTQDGDPLSIFAKAIDGAEKKESDSRMTQSTAASETHLVEGQNLMQSLFSKVQEKGEKAAEKIDQILNIEPSEEDESKQAESK